MLGRALLLRSRIGQRNSLQGLRSGGLNLPGGPADQPRRSWPTAAGLGSLSLVRLVPRQDVVLGYLAARVVCVVPPIGATTLVWQAPMLGCMSRQRSAAWRVPVPAGLLALGVLGYAVVLLAHPLSLGATLAVDDLGQLVAAAAAAVCCAAAGRRALPPRTRWAWWLLSAGTAAWAAGEAVWSYDELIVGRTVPFPSLADAGFLAFPVLAGVALLLLPTGQDAAASRLRDLLDGLIIAGSLLIVTWATSLGAALSSGGATRLAAALSLAYPLGDLVVMTLVLLVIGRATAGRRVVLGLLAAGLLALAAADSAFVYLTSTGSYASGSLCDLGWVLGFALLALAALLTGASGAAVRPDRACVPSWLRLALPYLPLLLAEAVVTGQLLMSDGRVPGAEIVLGLGLVVLVSARQFLTLAENRRLLVELRSEREHARYQALHDPLTGLANRTLFYDRVEHALALRPQAGLTAVLFCDLDDFKTVNDGLGHAVGDALLVAVASRLRGCLRAGDTVARLGGDEFAVLLEQRTESPAQVADRLLVALAAPLTLSGTRVQVTASVGLATAEPEGRDGLDVDELLRRADTAMYAAKGRGKATCVAYNRHRQDVGQPLMIRLPQLTG